MTDFSFPDGFLWGAATAAHQVEGGNSNCDSSVLEHLPGTIYREPSGDACDHYHRYPADIALLGGLGFNAYRFSIEWARVEPEEGEFSRASLEHYRRMLAGCREHGLVPFVTFHHFTSPRWLIRDGGWLDDRTPERFARYCEHATAYLGDLMGGACTLNEANIAPLLSKLLGLDSTHDPWWQAAAAAFGVPADQVGIFQFNAHPRAREVIMAAHRRAVDAIRGGPDRFPVGLTLALPDIQAGPGGEARAAELRRDLADWYFQQLGADDFLGVQYYTRTVVGPDGPIRPAPGVEVTQMGDEFYPEGLAHTIRAAAAGAKVPIYVTENGIATTDDTRRVAYYQGALKSVAQCISDGIDVRGYFCWSAFDNYEWNSGYRMQFGLIAVDRQTQARTVKPSARWVGSVARANRLPA